MRFPLRIIVLFLAFATACWGQAFDKAVLDRVKDSTVFIKVSIPKLGEASGSGFVIRGAGDTVLIMTNRHVVVPDEGELPPGAKPRISVVFRSGTPQQQELPATLLDYDAREIRDLAVLEVHGVRQVPETIAADVTSTEADFFETMQVFALGFPRGREMQAIVGNRNNNPAITVTSMSISSFRRDETGRLGRVQLNGSAIEGNSGGPLVDAKGRLVGVIVARLRGEAVGFAIPPSVIAQFLNGDVGQLNAELVSLSGGNATLKIQAKLVDPLRKIQSITIYAAHQMGTSLGAAPDARGSWPLLTNVVQVPMTIADKVATGQINLVVNNPQSRKVFVQFGMSAADYSYNTKPIPVEIPEKPGTLGGLAKSDRPSKPPQWSCEVNLAEGVSIKTHPGGASIDLPPGKAMVNSPQYKLFNAPSALVQVEGDFVGAVQVTNDFDPGATSVNAPTGKKFPFTHQGAGFLLWQDSKNFVRLERCKGSNDKGVLIHRILVEIYKDGRLLGLHYSRPIREAPILLAARRKGTSIQLLYGEPPGKLVVFQEVAIEFKPSILVGLSASNVSKQPFKAKFDSFVLRTPEGSEIPVKPVTMTTLTGGGPLPRGGTIGSSTPKPAAAVGPLVFEGATLKVLSTTSGSAEPQDNMTQFKGKWTDDRQLRWNASAKGDALSVDLPVETAGKFDVTVTFTMAPDHGQIKTSLDTKPLFSGKYIDYYYAETRPARPILLGTVTLDKGSHKFTITVHDKNAKSQGFGVGIDEIQLVPAKK